MRIFLECQEVPGPTAPAPASAETPPPVYYTDAVDVVFPAGATPCRLRGVDQILVLKKFYKLVHSLEERAREHGNDRRAALESVEGWVEHLGYTRNARDFTGRPEPKPLQAAESTARF